MDGPVLTLYGLLVALEATTQRGLSGATVERGVINNGMPPTAHVAHVEPDVLVQWASAPIQSASQSAIRGRHGPPIQLSRSATT